MVVLTLAGAASAASALNASLQIFKSVREKLVRQPDPAAEKLRAVFSQLESMYSLMDSQLSLYSGIVIWEDMDRRDYALIYRQPTDLLPEVLQARMRPAKASCSAIANIYEKFLKDWFHRVFGPGSQEDIDLEDLFVYKLGEGDETFVTMLDNLSWDLGNFAQILRNLLNEEKWKEAIKIHAEQTIIVDQTRRELAKAWISLSDFRNEFQESTGATTPV